MDLTTYETLTGTTIPTSKEDYYEALIAKTKSQLEGLLGYSLDTQSGTSKRYFDYHKNDKYIVIDPCESITSIKLIEDDETIYELDEEEYREHIKYGSVKYIEICSTCYTPCYKCVQLEVEAEWLFETIPTDLQYLWAEMITYEADPSNNIKSQTLGTHSYTKASTLRPEDKKENKGVLDKYTGGHGSAIHIPTL